MSRPFGTTPRIKTYTVAGTFKIGMTQYDTSFIFMPLDEAQLFFNYDDSVSGIEVMVADPDNDLAMLPAISEAAGRGHAAGALAGHQFAVSSRRCRSSAM